MLHLLAAAFARSAMGPFYCPRDQRIYLDTAFFDDLQNKFGGCSDSKACRFSEAYVIAHEVGHHVQNELGILPRVMQAQQAAASQTEANELQVRVELQADCFAGVWANRAQAKHHFLDPGDVDEALLTASAIGDDRLQKETQGYVVPDSFTHGTAAQRKRWFQNGFNSGQVSGCDTMSASTLQLGGATCRLALNSRCQIGGAQAEHLKNIRGGRDGAIRQSQRRAGK